MRVLQHHEGEADNVRLALKRHHGIECKVEREARPVATGTMMTTADVTLYSYNRVSNGERVWLVEVRLFSGPDAEWWRSWVLDAEPSDEQIAALLIDNVQEGSRL